MDRARLAEFRQEHAPQGSTEEHLVEELAGIIWRKRRLRLAEASTHRDGLRRTMTYSSDTASSALAHLHGGDTAGGVEAAIRDTPADTKEALRDLKADEAMTRRALELIGSRRNDRYEAAVEALRVVLGRLSAFRWWNRKARA